MFIVYLCMIFVYSSVAIQIFNNHNCLYSIVQVFLINNQYQEERYIGV